MDLWAQVGRSWHYLVAALSLVISLCASGHVLIFKRDPRAAILWLWVVWMLPLVGAVLYFLFGVNRIRRWAGSMRGGMERYHSPHRLPPFPTASLPEPLSSLARAVETVATRPLLAGNRIECLVNGDEAFPAMLSAIGGAQYSISLSTYIFDADEVGHEFGRALGEAKRRGVEVRVLIDATGARYSWPPITRHLRREGVRYARFLRLFPLRWLMAMNLRNHRKLLIVDGVIGFTGGMNLRVGHWLSRQPRRPVRDMHFRVEGPIVAHLQEVFVDDWQFTAGEALRGERWFPPLVPTGPVVARGIVDGPDEDFERLRWTLLAALSAARTSIRISTPYFLPDAGVMAALDVAAMRGVSVKIMLPSANNLPFVHWASRAQWWQLLQYGCRIWLGPPPFDHTKLFVVDDAWSLIGSANWDPRSLRLNFEFNLEAYDPGLAKGLVAQFDARLRESQEVTLEDVDARSLPVRLLDGAARLLTPFL